MPRPIFELEIAYQGRPLILRELEPSLPDARELLELTNRVAAEGWLGIPVLAETVDGVVRFLQQAHHRGAVLLGLFDGGALIGHAGIDPVEAGETDWPGTGALVIYLDSPYRSQGLGHSLLAASIGVARRRGFRRLVAVTRTGNRAALALYRKAGFRLVARMDDPQDGAVFRLELRL